MQTIEKRAANQTPLTISYLRFSRPEQLQGDSIRRQTEGAEKYCRDHGLELSDRLEDRGISGFRGKNRTQGNLSAFLELVQAGTVPAGSILIVEDLDRLSRQAPEEALELFLSIIRAGVTIVTLIDGQEYRKGELDMMRLMSSIMRICLAHEESSKKSMRLGRAWQQKRADIATGKVLTSILPNWLTVRSGKVVIDETKAEPFRQMFRLIIEGFGTSVIADKLQVGRSYVSKCLHNPQVIGEFQPHKLAYDAKGDKRREPIGKPIQGYYPAIIDEQTYYAVQRIMASRRHDTGPAKEFVNLFKSLLYNADDQSPMVTVNKGGSGRQYVSAAAAVHKNGAAEYIAVPIDVIETALLDGLCLARNIEPSNSEPLATELSAVENRFAEVAAQIGKLAAALATAGNVAAVVEVIAKLEAEKKQLADRRRDLQSQLADLSADEGRTAHLYFKANRHVGDNEGRTKLRAQIRKHIRRIEIKATKEGHFRTACWTIIFTEGVRFSSKTKFHTRNAEAISQEEKAREMWRQAARPVLIARETGMSVSQVYRVCAGIKREGKWRPASRWNNKG